MKQHFFKADFLKNSLLLLLIISISSCYVIRAYKFRKLQLMDHEKLPSLPIAAADKPFEYFEDNHHQYNTSTTWLDSNLNNSYTAAFLVIKNDSVIYEKYFDNYTRKTLLPSFSVAKSFVSTLVGIAQEEGKIQSLYDPITKYIPELLHNDERFKNITVQNLLDMRSGIQWSEGSYGLKDDAIKMGFRPNIMRYIMKIKIATAPQDDAEYKSINTMLLGLIITKATGKPLTQYLQEKIWQPMGMESKATWNTDKKHLPITYGGLNATARDYAKLGSLFIKKGNWNGQQVISEHWIQSSVSRDSMAKYNGYRNQWWGVSDYQNLKDSLQAADYSATHPDEKVGSYKNKTGVTYYYAQQQSSRFYAEGILGQFVLVSPDKKVVVVRLGHNWNHPKYSLERFLEEAERKF